MFFNHPKPSSCPKVFLCGTLLLCVLFSESVISVDIDGETRISTNLGTSKQQTLKDIFSTIEFKVKLAGTTTIELVLNYINTQLNQHPITRKFDDSLIVNVTYQLVPPGPHMRNLCLPGDQGTGPIYRPENYLENCQKQIFEFDPHNENNSSYDLRGVCDPRHTIFKVQNNSRILLSGLLPYQIYYIKPFYSLKFNASLLFEGEELYACLLESRPQYPPQTDLASFSLGSRTREEHKRDNEEPIDLFWRPLPKVFIGYKECDYDIYCEDDHHKTVPTQALGNSRARVFKRAHQIYVCSIRTRNSWGLSPDQKMSPIVIPKNHNLIRLGEEFKFHVFTVSNERYLLEWTPIRFNNETRRVEVLPRRTKETFAVSGGSYTIYWCVSDHKKACSTLDGIKRLGDSTSHDLILPDSGEYVPRTFGVSFISSSEPHLSTGIIWSKCVASFEDIIGYNQFMIIKATEVENDHTAISLTWGFDGCDSTVAVIKKIQVQYCEVSHLDDCSVIWSSPKSEIIENTDKIMCATVNITSGFAKEATIKHLKASTRYRISMRFIHFNGTFNSWSDPVYSATVADPSLLTECWYKIELFSFIFILLTGITCIILYSRSKKWYRHVHSILFRFKKTKATMANVVSDIAKNDTLSEMTLRYCVNREKSDLSRANSEISLNNLSIEESFRLADGDRCLGSNLESTQGGHSHANQIFDYILRNLIEENNEDSTPEACSESTRGMLKFDNSSEQDEISISSHPLEWDTNSNDQVDFNNNPKTE